MIPKKSASPPSRGIGPLVDAAARRAGRRRRGRRAIPPTAGVSRTTITSASSAPQIDLEVVAELVQRHGGSVRVRPRSDRD